MFSVDGIEQEVIAVPMSCRVSKCSPPRCFLALEIDRNRKEIDLANREEIKPFKPNIFYCLSNDFRHVRSGVIV